jgi:hypothetical protein
VTVKTVKAIEVFQRFFPLAAAQLESSCIPHYPPTSVEEPLAPGVAETGNDKPDNENDILSLFIANIFSGIYNVFYFRK